MGNCETQCFDFLHPAPGTVLVYQRCGIEPPPPLIFHIRGLGAGKDGFIASVKNNLHPDGIDVFSYEFSMGTLIDIKVLLPNIIKLSGTAFELGTNIPELDPGSYIQGDHYELFGLGCTISDLYLYFERPKHVAITAAGSSMFIESPIPMSSSLL